MPRALLIIMGVTGGLFLLLLLLFFTGCILRRRRKYLGIRGSAEDLLASAFSLDSKSKLSDIGTPTKDEDGSSLLSFFLPQPPPKRKYGNRESFIGRVNPDIYTGGSEELEAFHFTPNDRLGIIDFSILMEYETESLIVSILTITGLPERIIDKNNKELPNSFVRVTLLPDQTSQQTKVQRATTSPVFNECLVFSVVPGTAVQKRLRISVYDVDKKNVRYSLGHVAIPLESVDLQEKISYRLRLEILENILNTHLGDLELSLTAIPDAGKIKVGVLSCKGFNEFSYDPNSDHNCNVFIRLYLYRGQRMVRFRETSSCRLHSDIFFNEYFNFSIPLRHFDQTHFILMIMLSSEAKDPGLPVGRVDIGPYLFARGEELMHWQQAVDNPRTTITMFHMIESPEIVKPTCCEDRHG